MDGPYEKVLDCAKDALDARQTLTNALNSGNSDFTIDRRPTPSVDDAAQAVALADSRFETAFRDAVLHALRYDERLRKAAQQV